jgi:hypothetical protein
MTQKKKVPNFGSELFYYFDREGQLKYPKSEEEFIEAFKSEYAWHLQRIINSEKELITSVRENCSPQAFLKIVEEKIVELLVRINAYEDKIFSFEKKIKLSTLQGVIDYMHSPEIEIENKEFEKAYRDRLHLHLWQNELDRLKNELSKHKDKPKLTFTDLFDPGYRGKIPALKSILSRLGYLNNNGMRPHGFNTAVFINLFHWLKDKSILLEGNRTTQAKIFLREFGINVSEKGGDITTRTIRKGRPKTAPTPDPDIISLFKN